MLGVDTVRVLSVAALIVWVIVDVVFWLQFVRVRSRMRLIGGIVGLLPVMVWALAVVVIK